MFACTKLLVALSIGLLGALLGYTQPSRAQAQNPVTAIDILLEPDATMIKHAEAANERLLKGFPKGFALGKTHQPHISMPAAVREDGGSRQGLRGRRQSPGRGEADCLEVEGVQVLLHPLEGTSALPGS